MNNPRKSAVKRLSRSQATLLTSVLYYREMASRRLVTFWSWLLQSIYSLNPYFLWQSDGFWKWCVLWYCAVRARFSVDEAEQERLLQWASFKIRGVPMPINFTTSWRDGLALCALMEDLSPGSCPRFDLLNPEHCQSNVHLALKMAQRHLKMKPSISIKEMVECLPSGERKLICLISQLKMTENWKQGKLAAMNDAGLPLIRVPGDGERSFGLDKECVAKGMGLMLAVKGRKATFNIFLKTSANLNIVIEIKGPNNSIASQRITNRSPKRRTPIKQGTPVVEASTLFRSGDIRRSISMSSENEQDCEGGPIKIPFEYELQQGKISVGYIPKETGKHRLSIINEGQHIMGSPYTITVDDSHEMSAETKSKINKHLLTSFNKGDSFEMDTPSNTSSTDTLKPNFGIHGSPFTRGCLANSSKKLGMVTKRRVLRHILTIDGREVVVEDADAEHLGMAIQALKEVEDSECLDIQSDLTDTKNKISRQNSVDEIGRDSELIYRHVLCPVHEDMDLKEVSSPSPKMEVDCGPIFNQRPRAVSYTESEISSMDGIDTGGALNQDSFKWNVVAEVPDSNQNYDSIATKNYDIIPRLEITNVAGDDSQEDIEGKVTPAPVSFLDTNNSNDETDSITPEFSHVNEMVPNNDIRDNYDKINFEQNEILRQRGSSTGGSESDEWLLISMDVKTKVHSLQISDQEVQSPVSETQCQDEVEDSIPVEDTLTSTEVEEFERNYKPEEPEEYHSMEENQYPISERSKPCTPKTETSQISTGEANAEAILETVTDRKQFFENLFIQTNSKNSSPIHSPVKSGTFSPRASPSNRPITTSYSVDESLTSQIKKKFTRGSDLTPKSHSLCSLSDDTVDTSPNFLKAKTFWERGSVMSETARVSRESVPEVSSKKNSPVEEEAGASIRQKLDFWQTLTTSSKPTTPDHETSSRGDRGIRKTDFDGIVGENPTIELIVKDSRESLLESPGSEDTRDSGVFISWPKLSTPAPETDRFGSQGRAFSDPGTSEAENRNFMASSNTRPFSNSFVFRQNPLFSLDTDKALEQCDFESVTDESNGLNETMSDDRGYIDDEIPDYASLMMDRYISFTGLLDNDRLLSRNELIGLGIEGILGNCYGGDLSTTDSEKTLLLPHPGKCRAFGAGVYYGQVGVRNQFQVCTQGAGKGYLTVSVQGSGEHDVTEVVVSYMGDESYEVMYEVLEPGYYIISVKWSEWNIPESPFICKVTY